MILNEIYCGDNVEILSEFEDNSVDLTVTSPPYDNLRKYNGFSFDFEGIAKQLYRVTKQGGVVVWVVSDKVENGTETGTSFKQALHFKDMGFYLHDTMIYKTHKMPVNDNRYQPCFEFMFVLSKGKPKTFNPIKDKENSKVGIKSKSSTQRNVNGTMRKMNKRKPTEKFSRRENIWHFDSGYNKTTTDIFAYKHPAMFPEELARDHIITWSNEGDLVLDCFCGAGTTLKMAKQTNRNFIGIDISSEYVELSKRRVG